MDIRNFATYIDIEVSGIEVAMLLSKEKIVGKYLEVMEGETISRKKKELLKTLNLFAKSLYLKERVDEETLEQVICFNVITGALAISFKAIILSKQRVEDILPELISEQLVLDVLEKIKTAYITEWSHSVPMKNPQTIVEALFEDIYS